MNKLAFDLQWIFDNIYDFELVRSQYDGLPHICGCPSVLRYDTCCDDLCLLVRCHTGLHARTKCGMHIAFRRCMWLKSVLAGGDERIVG